MSRTHVVDEPMIVNRSASAVSLPLYTHRASQPMTPGQLRDSHGRVIRDLRFSLTDRCNLRCQYCMSPAATFLPRKELLSVADLVRVTRACMSLGVTKIRLTGGEPTLRPELEAIIAGIAELAPADLAMTTNGLLATPERLARWKALGLQRITFSIDAADEARFRQITRSQATPGDVVAAVRAAQGAGFLAIKLNAVLIRHLNDDQAVPLATLARVLGVELRFIEYMPLDGEQHWDASQLIPADQTLAAISHVYPLTAIRREHASSTAELYGFADGAPGRIGFIAPVTRSFCGACNRLRISADGRIRPCLFGNPLGTLRTLLDAGAGDGELAAEIARAAWHKQAGHGIGTQQFRRPEVAMNAIGG